MCRRRVKKKKKGKKIYSVHQTDLHTFGYFASCYTYEPAAIFDTYNSAREPKLIVRNEAEYIERDKIQDTRV